MCNLLPCKVPDRCTYTVLASSNCPQALASDGEEGPLYIEPPQATPKTASFSSREPSQSSSAILGDLYVMPEKETGNSGVGVEN